MRGSAVGFAARISLLSMLVALGASLGACTLPDWDSFRTPDSSALFRPLSVTNVKDRVLPPVAPEDLVDASGRCAGSAVPLPATADQPAAQGGVSLPDAGVPMIPSAIALEMNECDVVKRAGFPERVDIGSNERNERTATLTYINGQRPGIYRFTAGRLTSMERAPEPPAPPPKPVKKKPIKPAKRGAAPAPAPISVR